MRHRPWLASLIACAAVCHSVFAAEETAKAADPYAKDPYWYQPGHPVSPAEATAIKTAPGFKAERVLTVPREMGSWTALCVDPQGRLITSAQQQPGLFRVTPPPLDDSGAEAKVEKLGGVAARIGWSQGLLYAFDSLYVTVTEENDQLEHGVYRLQDTDGDGEFDRSTFLFKLDGSGEHGPHNLVVSPDGRAVVMACGNGTRVPADLQNRRPTATTGVDHLMPPGFASSHYSAQGWILRFDPDGNNRELILGGLRNSFDLAFDESGELFTFDSDAEWDLGTPWYRPTRICHLVSGGEYGWRDDAAVWPEYFDDSVAPVRNIGPGSPSGLTFGNGAKFPAKYQRALFVCDWTFATVHAIFLKPDGASYRADVEEFVGGAGLPLTDVVIGKDGAMYLIVGGRRLGSAVYRIRYVGTGNVDAIPPPSKPDAETLRRRELEQFHGHAVAGSVDKIWNDLGNSDRSIRFAARVALETQPLSEWHDRVFQQKNPEIALTALLALARQGSPADQLNVVRACAELPWSTFSADQKLRGLRVYELALARGGESVAAEKNAFAPVLTARFPDADSRVSRELSRLRCALGDTTIIDPALALMQADKGEGQALGSDYFQRNPKYGQAVRAMLEAAPLLERMHHAQMLLWLAEKWTPAQRRTYFQSLADAVAFSKGGYRYADFWRRIREAALEHTPADQRAALADIIAPPIAETTGAGGIQPQGPGRTWTVDAAAEIAGTRLTGRDFTRGKGLFTTVGCAGCHRLAGEGGLIGPDLTGVGQRFTTRDLLEAIIEPSRAISDQYRMVMIQTKDGHSYSGRILSRDADSTRIATNLMRPSQTTSVSQDVIVSERALPVSVMPSGLVDALNEDELLDLVAFVTSGGDEHHRVFAPLK